LKRQYRPPDVGPLRPPADLTPWGDGRLAVITPVYKAELTADEAVSLDSLRRRRPCSDLFLVAPEGLALDFDTHGFTVRRLPPENFDGIAAYNALMLQAWFYRLFAGYRRLLIFQTDCLLLRGDLGGWAERDWSYVGAPWFDRRGRPKAVGNGGLSLRSPEACLSVLESERLQLRPTSLPQARQFAKPKHLGVLLRTRKAAAAPDGRPLGQRFAGAFPRPEDEFWSFYAPLLHPGFRVPPASQAVDFAAESRPQRVVELNGGHLPVGAHAWAREDREWWLQQLARTG
jgi:hypothetical protein